MNIDDSATIICGTDFSENSDKAAAAADAIARNLGLDLILAHSVDERGEFPDHVRARLMKDEQPRLFGQAEKLRENGVALREKMLPGVPEDGIAQFAAQTAARLVVVGANAAGANWIGRLVHGNVAARIAESSPAPTLIVRDAAPFEEWARGSRALRALVAVDFSNCATAALRWVAELREGGPCEVIAAYADWPPEEAARLGIRGPVGLDENPPEIQRTLERDIREKLNPILGIEGVTVLVRANSGRTDSALVEMAVEAKADLIVAGTHQWRGLARLKHGSVSRGILQNAPMNVACVPAPAGTPVTGPRVRECPRVLAAVDIHESHGFAAQYAYGITSSGGTVRLMHNIEASDALERTDFCGLETEAGVRLRALSPLGEESRGIITEVEITESADTAAAICAAAERFNADIICIGSHTRPGLSAKLLGSVAIAVLQTSDRPVLVVRPPTD